MFVALCVSKIIIFFHILFFHFSFCWQTNSFWYTRITLLAFKINCVPLLLPFPSNFTERHLFLFPTAISVTVTWAFINTFLVFDYLTLGYIIVFVNHMNLIFDQNLYQKFVKKVQKTQISQVVQVMRWMRVQNFLFFSKLIGTIKSLGCM